MQEECKRQGRIQGMLHEEDQIYWKDARQTARMDAMKDTRNQEGTLQGKGKG